MISWALRNTGLWRQVMTHGTRPVNEGGAWPGCHPSHRSSSSSSRCIDAQLSLVLSLLSQRLFILLVVIHGPRPSSIILLFPIPTYFSHFKMKFIIIMIIINSVTTSFSYSLLPPFFFLLNLAGLNGAIKNFVDLFYHREFCSLINIRLCLILSKFKKKIVRNKH